MKRFIAILFVVIVSGIHALYGEGFSIEWQVLDATVGTSTGGSYSITGIIGQPNASTPMTGGEFSISGGVTGLAVALREQNSPALRIEPRGANLLIAWPSSGMGFHLQQSSSLITPGWNEVLVTPTVAGSENQILLPFAAGHRFFRLHKP